MVPDIEREWIAEECRSAPRSWGAWILLILLVLAIGSLLLECLS